MSIIPRNAEPTGGNGTNDPHASKYVYSSSVSYAGPFEFSLKARRSGETAAAALGGGSSTAEPEKELEFKL